jgi:hypothetical protein
MSGTTYLLQVTIDDKFEDIILEKEGLVASEYTLTKEENLKPVVKNDSYYWRVKSVDNAGNESAWSEEASFYLGFVLTLPNGETELALSAIVVYIVVAIGVLVISTAFFIGRRTSRRRIYLREAVSNETLKGEPPVKLLE